MIGEVPYHSAEFGLFVEAYPMINGVELMAAVFEENMTAFAVSVVGEDVKKNDRSKFLFIFDGEIEVVIFDVVFDVLLQRTGSMRTIFTIDCDGYDMQAKGFA